MSTVWDRMRIAKEEQYFERENNKALCRLAEEMHKPKSPESGRSMEKYDMLGLSVYRCPDTGGVWLKREQLAQLLEGSKNENLSSAIKDFFIELFKMGTEKR